MDENSPDPKSSVVRTAQIIILALAAGVLIFALIVLFLAGGGFKPWNARAMVSLMMAGLSMAMVLARFVVPPLLVQVGREKIVRGTGQSPVRKNSGPALPETDEGRLLMIFQTQIICGGALLESAAFCNLVAFQLEGQSYSLILGMLLLAGILAGIPTRHSLENWLERQLRSIRETRDMGNWH